MNTIINAIFHSADSIYFVFTDDGGATWSTPAFMYQGTDPAIDVCQYGLRHLAWQSLDNDIYYDCIDDWSPPVNVSQSPGLSTLPDLVVDSGNVVHMVWVEQVSNHNQIYYRTIEDGTLGDTIRISDYGSTEATCTRPCISIFEPNNRIYVVWECFDSSCYSPYQIHMKYLENNVWSATTALAHYLPMRHPSIDYSHGQDTVGFCYEDSTSGNMEATFIGGNGGGYPTQGYSTNPVVSTVGDVWSYLFWQEDSLGNSDICIHLYYFMSGWAQHSLRTLFGIQESVRCPNASDAYLVWTQGDSPPYSVYFANFGYPIAINENSLVYKKTLTAQPNPFNRTTEFTMDVPRVGDFTVFKIYDICGRLVRDLSQEMTTKDQRCVVQWTGDDETGRNLPAGIYMCHMIRGKEDVIFKVVKLE